MAVNFVVKSGEKKSVQIKSGQAVTLGKGVLKVGDKVIAEVQNLTVTPEHKPKFKSLTAEQVLVDEMVTIDQKLKEMEADVLQKRFEEVKKQLAATAKTLPPEKPATFQGSIGQVEFSAARVESKINDKDDLIAALDKASGYGQKLFNEIASVSITDLKKYLSEDELNHLLEKVYGSRTLKSVVAFHGTTSSAS